LPAASRVTPWTEVWRKFRRQHVALAAGAFVVLLVLVAVVAPALVPYDAENFFDYDRINARPSWQHWFGVDPLGRDIFSRIVMGARISLTAGFVSVAAGALVGTLLGLVAGYYELVGPRDHAPLRRAVRVSRHPARHRHRRHLGSGMANVIIAVAVFSIRPSPAWCAATRLAKHLTYVEAARSVGASDATIILRHIFPGTISSVVVYFSMRIGTSIITAASLSFLGMGAQPPTPEWGAMLGRRGPT
jgi:glutathione transport system permease protein